MVDLINIILLLVIIFFFILTACNRIKKASELRKMVEENEKLLKRNLELKKQIETLTLIVESIYRVNSEHFPGHHDGFNHGDRYL